MFFIVNKTKGSIVISDIGVTLGPRQAVDLDKMMSRSKSESSRMLKGASKKGHIDIRIKDNGKTSKVSPAPKVDVDLDDFKKEMLEEMKGLLSQQQPAQTPQPGLGKEDLAAFAEHIINNIPKSETVIMQGQQPEVREDEEVEIEVGELGEMNKRIVNKIVENVKSVDIKYNEEIQKNDLDNNIIELEGLLDL